MRAAITTALLVGVVVTAFAQSPKCRVCERPIEGKYFNVEDRAHGGKAEVCSACADLESRCFACGLPVKSTATKLADGRFLCERDAKEAILETDEARKICLNTREELDRLYWRFLTFPSTNVSLNLVDQFTLTSLFKAPGYSRRCTAIFGATSTHALADGAYVHTISILSGLNRNRLEAVAAHEFAHTWLNENLSVERMAALAPEAIEAFCELVACQRMEQQQAEFEKQSIKENPYTRGQLDAFLKAEAIHGFNTVLEWLKSGEAANLDPEDPDGIRSVRATAAPSTSTPSINAVNLPPAPLPGKLALKGITGPPGRRFAIINERTFAVMDLANMRLARTNLLIRCLEIRTNSVVIRMEGTGQKQELFLPDE
jgi:hypothetical protein